MSHRAALRQGWEARKGRLAARLAGAGRAGGRMLASRAAAGAPPRPADRLRRRVFERFLAELEARGSAGIGDLADTRSRVRRIIDETLAARDSGSLDREERARLEDRVVNEIWGLGPIEPLMADPSVSDILVNGPEEVWVDRYGRLERTAVRFDDEAHVMRLLGRLVASHGRHLDEASPWVDVRLPDGSRLHALIPPLAEHPVISIRQMRPRAFTLGELVAVGTLGEPMAEMLAAAVAAGLNIVVSGGAATGKTTLLNVIAGYIPPEERVVTIEETIELRFDHPHVVQLEARLPNIEGRGEVTLRTLVRNALRMRADRIVVGEVRGAEVFDMLQAMNTGHEGSLTTVHANSPADALRRLESLVLMGGFELPSRAIRELLGAAFDLSVHITRFLDGSRKVTSIGEVILDEGGLATRELFRFERDGERRRGAVTGRHVVTGERPAFAERLAESGFSFDPRVEERD